MVLHWNSYFFFILLSELLLLLLFFVWYNWTNFCLSAYVSLTQFWMVRHVSLIIFRAYISITDRVIPDFLRNFFMQVNIIIYYLCNVLLVLDVLNALHCFSDSMYLRGEMKCPYPQTYKQKQTISWCFQS